LEALGETLTLAELSGVRIHVSYLIDDAKVPELATVS
jgi:hypothetical protein